MFRVNHTIGGSPFKEGDKVTVEDLRKSNPNVDIEHLKKAGALTPIGDEAEGDNRLRGDERTSEQYQAEIKELHDKVLALEKERDELKAGQPKTQGAPVAPPPAPTETQPEESKPERPVNLASQPAEHEPGRRRRI